MEAAASPALVFSSEIGRVQIWTLRGFVKLRLDPLKREKLRSGLCLATANGGFRKNGVAEGDGVIIVDHGSRRDESNLMLRITLICVILGYEDEAQGIERGLEFITTSGDIRGKWHFTRFVSDEFVDIFRERTKFPIVEPAHMELAEPSIKDAFDLCIQQGAKRVIVSPFFLSPGRHWNKDIPSLTAEAAKEHPGVSYIVTAPLGLHELLVDVVNDRINYCLSHVASVADECRVCAETGKCRLYN